MDVPLQNSKYKSSSLTDDGTEIDLHNFVLQIIADHGIEKRHVL